MWNRWRGVYEAGYVCEYSCGYGCGSKRVDAAPEAVTLRGAGTVLVAACPMPLLTNTVSGRR